MGKVSPLVDRQYSYVIMAAELEDQTKLDKVHNRQHLSSSLIERGYYFMVCTGQYKSVLEHSFVVAVENITQVRELIRLAQTFDQESVLLVTKSYNCYLFYIDTRQVSHLGTWHEVTKHTATETDLHDAYTKFIDGKYYVVS